MYRKTVQSVPFINTNPEAVIRELQLRDEAEWELFQALYAAAARWFPRQEDTANCGYAVKDLNGDGVMELIWLTREGQVVAVFSSVNGEASAAASAEALVTTENLYSIKEKGLPYKNRQRVSSADSCIYGFL